MSQFEDAFPTIAVVIPCYNAEKWVAHAIHSVLDQNYPKLEIIVIDDGSTDKSLEVINSFGDQISWQTGANRGSGAARNAGFRLSRSKYVLFLDADDYLVGGYLRGLGDTARKNGADICLGRLYIQCGDRLLDQPIDHFSSDAVITIRGLLNYRMIQTSQALWSRVFFERIGLWDESLSSVDDMELALRGIKERPNLAFSHDGRCVWREHDNPDRLTRRTDARKFESDLYVFDRFHDWVCEVGDPVSQTLLARHYYALAQRSSRCAHDQVGALALSKFYDLGGRGHLGGVSHQIATRFLGLRRKEKIAVSCRRLQSQWLNLFRRF